MLLKEYGPLILYAILILPFHREILLLKNVLSFTLKEGNVFSFYLLCRSLRMIYITITWHRAHIELTCHSSHL
jgi:hypothetical protein